VFKRISLTVIGIWAIPILFVGIVIALALGGGESYKLVVSLILGAILALYFDPLKQMVLLNLQGPRLEIELDEYLPPGTPERVFLRLQVTNAKPRVAAGCRAYVANIETFDTSLKDFAPTQFRDTFPLHWAYDGTLRTVDIPKRVPRYADVAIFTQSQQGFIPQITNQEGETFDVPRYSDIWGQYGHLRLTVLIVAEGITPEVRYITFDWQGNWPPTFEMTKTS
jgi:hypothetical protein